MSFDVYIQVFAGGGESGFALSRLRDVFREHLVELEEDFWQLRFSDGESSDLFLQPSAHDPSLIHTLSVHRPCSDSRLWDSLYQLLEAPGTLFHFPGCTTPLSRDAHIAAAAPSALLAALGAPRRIDDAEQLRRSLDDD